MKESGSSPREILLASHRSAEPKLDKIRAQVLQDNFAMVEPCRQEFDSRLLARVLWAIWREIFAPAKATWGAIAVVWLLILSFHFTDRGAVEKPASNLATARPASGDRLLAFREQEQLLKELIGTVPAATAVDTRRRKDLTKPRSEGLSGWRFV